MAARVGLEARPERLVSVGDLSRMFGFSIQWWYRRAEEGAIPSLKLGKARRFILGDVQRWLEEHRSMGRELPR